jgi:MinD-like ATPase involved in chromosome partitioning or flagellar assembly
LVNHKAGIRLLLASARPKEAELEQSVRQMEAVVENLASMCTAMVLDLGCGIRPYVLPLVSVSDRVVIVLEPVYPSNAFGRSLVDELAASGVPRHKMQLALITRERTSMQVPWQQIVGDLGIELAGVISAAPEQAHQAAQSGVPLVVLHPDSLVTDQIRKVVESIAAQLQLVEG